MFEWTLMKRLIWIKAAIISGAASLYETVTGAIVSFVALHAKALKKLVVNIEPVQDLHGYDAPWPPGGGKNKMYRLDSVLPLSGNDVTVSADGADGVKLTGTATSTIGFNVFEFAVENGKTYTVSFGMTTISGVYVNLPKFSNGTNVGNLGGITVGSPQFSFTCDGTFDHVRGRVTIDGGVNTNGIVIKVQAEEGSAASAWSPYANECPISGWTGADVWNETTYDPTADPSLQISWQDEAGTVYGGTVTVKQDDSVDLVADRAILTNAFLSSSATYENAGNGRFVLTENVAKLPSVTSTTYVDPKLIASALQTSSQSDLASNITKIGIAHWWGTRIGFATGDPNITNSTAFKQWLADNGSDVVYPLAEPVTYHLDSITQLSTVVGTNNIWADAGDVEVTYYAK